jgi:integrase
MLEVGMQKGSLIRSVRKRGPDVWQFRWADRGPYGKRIYRKRVIGTVCQYPEADSARKAVTGLLREISQNPLQRSPIPMTVAEASDHFIQRELTNDDPWRSYSTKKAYKAYLKRWIIPHWGTAPLSEVRTMGVESWLRRLPLAKSSCAKLRGLFSVLFNHCCRYEFFDRNPIRLVRQSAKRRSSPTVLTPIEIKLLLSGLRLRERALVLVATSPGLRQSELFGLRWGDIDFAQNTMSVTRSIVCGVVGPCKTESSQKPVPVQPTVLETLGAWKQIGPYNKPDDWVFASRRHRGRKPIWGQAILRRYIRPVASGAGIRKRFGWHTFRYTYSTLLRSVGTEFKVMQELLRHSSLRSTLDIYTQAISPAKHAAQAAVLALVFDSEPSSPALAVNPPRVDAALIEKKGCRKGAKMHPFAPTLVAAKDVKLF